ncbi:MAG: hypothetical protein V3V75_02885 [Thermoguttaceae bacterium]
MLAIGSKSNNTIRLGSSKVGGKTLYVFMFALTCLAVYFWGSVTAKQTGTPKRFAATATIIHHAMGTTGELAKGDLERAKEQITAEANLKKIIRQVRFALGIRPDNDSPTALDEVVRETRRNLRIGGQEVPSGSLKISLAYTDANADYASKLVDDLAERYADDCRTRWKTDTHQVYVETRDSLDRAQQAYIEAKARMDAFLAGHVKQTEVAKPDAMQPGQQEQTTPPRLEPVPRENPQWAELNAKLELLDERKEQLLVDRTPLHPQIEEVQLRIDDMRLELEKLHRWLAPENPPPVLVQPSNKRDLVGDTSQQWTSQQWTSQQWTSQQRAETAETLRMFKEEVERTGKAYDRAAAIEHQAWQEYLKTPEIDVELATAEVLTAPPDRRLGLLFVALAAGVGVVSGMRLISFGTSMDPILTSLPAVQAAVTVPVVGVVQLDQSGDEPSSLANYQSLTRATTVIGGLLVIAACLTAVAMTLRGFGS